eukprot:scaffold53455_cov68-Phaeocystis_antarctica.AAC.3
MRSSHAVAPGLCDASARPRAIRRRGLAGGTILRRGLGVPSIGPRSVLTIAAATTAASKFRQDGTDCRAPEDSCRRCLSLKQLQRFDGKHRSPGPRRLAPPSAKYETLPRLGRSPRSDTPIKGILVAYAVTPLISDSTATRLLAVLTTSCVAEGRAPDGPPQTGASTG